MPRAPYIVALVAAACAGEVAFVGWTPVKALMTTRVSLVPAGGGAAHVTLGVGDSLPVEACIRDGREGDEPRFVDDCARRHPMIFSFATDAPQVARVGERGTIRAVAPGHFKVAVRSMGRMATLEGDVVERIALALSARDTTLRIGDELLVGWSVVREDGGEAPLSDLEFASGTRVRITGSVDAATVLGSGPLRRWRPRRARIPRGSHGRGAVSRFENRWTRAYNRTLSPRLAGIAAHSHHSSAVARERATAHTVPRKPAQMITIAHPWLTGPKPLPVAPMIGPSTRGT